MTVVSLELPGNAAIDIKLICAKLVEDERFISVGVSRNIIEHYIVIAKLLFCKIC